MSKPQSVNLAVLAFLAAIIVVLTTTGAVHWSGEQITLVSVEAAAGGAFVLAVFWHQNAGTSKEPVAVGASLTALILATLYLLNGFDVTHFTGDAITAIGGASTAGVLLVTAAFARDNVTAPVTPAVPVE